jgi:hypothetical protein
LFAEGCASKTTPVPISAAIRSDAGQNRRSRGDLLPQRGARTSAAKLCRVVHDPGRDERPLWGGIAQA